MGSGFRALRRVASGFLGNPSLKLLANMDKAVSKEALEVDSGAEVLRCLKRPQCSWRACQAVWLLGLGKGKEGARLWKAGRGRGSYLRLHSVDLSKPKVSFVEI